MKEMKKLHLFAHCIFLLLHTNFAASTPKEWVDTLHFFKDPENRQLLNVVVDREDNVYVAGENVIHHFSPDLELKETVSTGPLMDHPDCMHPSYPCSKTKVSTDNENHILTMIYHLDARPNLLICGSVYRKLCQIRPVDNLTEFHWVHPFNQSEGYSSGLLFTATFLGRGYNDQNETLFTASADDPETRAHAAPFLTSKVIEKDGDRYYFRYAFQNDTVKSAIEFTGDSKRYVMDGGLMHDGFVYFLAYNSVPKLVRVCAQDGTFQSYSELPIACDHTTGRLQIALSFHLDESPSSDAAGGKSLYVTFSRTEGEHKGTALCIYPMTDVVNAFTKFPRDCLTTAGHICRQKMKDKITDFCGSGVSPYIVNRTLEVSYFNFIPALIFTAITTVKYYNEMVAIVGAKSGFMIKMSLSTGHIISINDMLDANSTGVFRSPFVFDRSKKHIYALTKNKIIKYPLSTCSVHRTCGKCLTGTGKKDPLKCGWCAGRCAHLQECSDLGSFTQDTCPPSILEVSPRKGPIQGGIKIKITGDSLGSYTDDAHNSITLAGIPCEVFVWKNEEVSCTLGPAPGEISGPVEIHVITLYSSSIGYSVAGSTSSHFNFSYYVGPKLYGIRPNKGPTSGGTRVTLFGDNLDFEKKKLGRHFIIRGRLCTDAPFRFNKTRAWCVTESETRPDYPDKIAIVVGNVTYVMDENPPPTFNYTDVYQSFEYIPDPEIHLLQPGITTVSGLMNVTVTGRYLNSVLSPQMVVHVSVSKTTILEFPNDCWSDPESRGTKLTCSTPSLELQPWLPAPTRTHPLLAHVSFMMDGVQWLREFPKRQEFMSRLLYYPDPEFKTFRDIEKITDDQTTMEIKGNHFDLLRSANHFEIRLGEEESCRIASISTELVVCDLPPSLKDSSLIGSNISVEVFMGSTSQHLGYIEIMSVEQNQVVWGLILLAICVLSLFAVIVVAFLCFRKLRKNKRVRSIHSIALANRPAAAHDYRPVATRVAPPANRQMSQTSCGSSLIEGSVSHFERTSFLDRESLLLFEEKGLIIQWDNLTVGELIGEGHFGRIFKGTLKLPNQREIKIALKTLRHHIWSDPTKAKDFMKEAVIMKDFKDDNVLGLLGVCFEGRVPYMVLDYMEYGDLCTYIRSKDAKLLVSDLLKFSLDVASGMCYLAKEKFVHRDLAARNCVLDSTKQAKVADFGLSRDIYEGDYYRSEDKDAELPQRWMAPEAIENNIFTTKSDVWSFGVLLWELMTRGSKPYPNVGNWEVLDYIKQGNRLKQPKYCPKALYYGMLACWNTDSKVRPDFEKLRWYVGEVLRRLLNDTLEEDASASVEAETLAGATSSSVAGNSLYYNSTVPAQNTEYFDSKELYLQMDGHALSKVYLEKK